MGTNKLAISLTSLIINLIVLANGNSVEEDLFLTGTQFKILHQFKQRVFPKLPHKYMEKDVYLIRWLRGRSQMFYKLRRFKTSLYITARNFNLDQAERMLMENLEWRSKENIDNLLSEDWSDMESDFPYYSDGIDKNGNPVITPLFGSWDLRAAAVSGKANRVQRYLYGMFETAEILIRKAQDEGKNVTRSTWISSIRGFSQRQHACLSCFGIYVTVVTTLESRFPRIIDKLFLVDSPQIFQIVINLITPIMSEDTRKLFKVYSTNKNEWTREVFKIIDRDQLHSELEGTKS